MAGHLWEVVGGADKGGILVRNGQDVGSPQLGKRLSTGAIVEELQLIDGRLNYKLVSGTGPEIGWVSIKLPGKELLVRKEAAPAAGGSEILQVPGGQLTIKAYEDYMATWHGEVPEVSVQPSESNLRDYTEEYFKHVMAGEVTGAATGKPEPGEGYRPDAAFEARRELSAKNKEMMTDLQPLPPFQKFKLAEVKKMAPQFLPGEMYGLPVPPSLADLYNLGADWLTKAFHAAGTLPQDNSVSSILEFKRLPMSGQDAAGGSGPKAFITLEYAKEDPELHKEIFVKMPWTVCGESKDMGGDDLWRWKISCHADNDGQEVTVYRMLGPLFPFKIPKYYFADICRANTNFILVTEKLIFGKKGQTSFAPFEIQPLAEKYFDFQLEPKLRYEMYYCLVRAQARMAAWEKMGYFDPVPHETRGHHMAPPPLGAFAFPRQLDPKMRDRQVKQGQMLVDTWKDFLLDKAKKAYPPELSEENFVQALTDAAYDITGWKDDLFFYHCLFPDMVGMMHSNLQSDNAYYWRDSEGELDCGIIDWGGLSPNHIALRLQGCITSALGEVLDEHEDGLLQCWIHEYWYECGVWVDFGELRRQWHMSYNTYIYSCGMNILQEVFRQTPPEEWKTINTLMDPRTAGRWNCRCYVFMILHMLKYLYIRWVRGGKKRLHCHDVFIDWKQLWLEKGMQ